MTDREAFEQLLADRGRSISSYTDSKGVTEYADDAAQEDWEVWQAALAYARQESGWQPIAEFLANELSDEGPILVANSDGYRESVDYLTERNGKYSGWLSRPEADVMVISEIVVCMGIPVYAPPTAGEGE